MAFNGTGVFERVHNWVSDKNANVDVTASRMDAEDDGFATGLSNCITKDGQTTITANLPMAGFKHTGVGDASSSDQYAAYGQMQSAVAASAVEIQDGDYTWGGTVGGTANAITITLAKPISAYSAGQGFEFVASAANTGSVTLNVDGRGVKNVTKRGAVALTTGDIANGSVVRVVYDGTQFQLQGCDVFSQGSNIASASTINLDSATWNVVDVTGSTTITAITLAQGREVTVRFAGSLSLTHGSNLVLPGSANIVTAAGDFIKFRGYSGGVVRAAFVQKASGAPVRMSPITNSLSGDVSLNNTANYFDGPSVAQGTEGTWFVSGTVTVIDTAGAAGYFATLNDGTTVIASTSEYVSVSTQPGSLSLSGFITAPAGNLRISVRDASSTSGLIKANYSGNSKDSTITAIRIG